MIIRFRSQFVVRFVHCLVFRDLSQYLTHMLYPYSCMFLMFEDGNRQPVLQMNSVSIVSFLSLSFSLMEIPKEVEVLELYLYCTCVWLI